MCHYVVEVSLIHAGIYANKTSIELDINFENGKAEQENYKDKLQ
jgi:hypothetical protein